MKYSDKILLTLGALLISPQALAHENGVSTGLLSGLIHPLIGLDHLLALILAGILIGRLIHRRRLVISGLLFALGLSVSGALLLGAQAWVEGVGMAAIEPGFMLGFLLSSAVVMVLSSGLGAALSAHLTTAIKHA